MPGAQRWKTETDRAIDYIARLLEDCEKLRRDMSKSASSPPLLKRRDKPSAKRVGRISKKQNNKSIQNVKAAAEESERTGR